jgi:hypothetical protein
MLQARRGNTVRIYCCLVFLFLTARPARSEQAPSLKTLVRAIDANDTNDTINKTVVPEETTTMPITFVVTGAAPKESQEGHLSASDLVTQTDVAKTLPVAIRPLQNAGAAGTGTSDVRLALDKSGTATYELQVKGLQRGSSYKGRINLSAGPTLTYHWDLNLTTGARGLLAVDSVPTLKIVTYPWCAPGSCEAAFPLTIYDKNGGRPYSHVSVRLLTSTTPAKSLTQSLTLDSFSFFDANGKEADLKSKGLGNVTIDQRQQQLIVKVDGLSPGEYTGTLQFAADETADDAAEGKLPITIDVRHHWIIPVLVILFGSVIGWFGSKYVAGSSKARTLHAQMVELHEQANLLARPAAPRKGWEFSSEATSYAFIKARVALNQLLNLTSSVLAVILRADDIEALRQDATRRLTALKSIHETRLAVQRFADGRPAVQRTLGRQLRSAFSIVERVPFGDTDQAELTKILQAINDWQIDEKRDGLYRQALLDRRNSSDLPNNDQMTGVAQNNPIRAQLSQYFNNLPGPNLVLAPTTQPADLALWDQNIARAALLWRERDAQWATTLGEASTGGQSLDDLFMLVDSEAWQALKTGSEAHQLKITQVATLDEDVHTYDFVETRLKSTVPDVDDDRILYHPLRLRWRVLTQGGDPRSIETDNLALLQYFPKPGAVKITASLTWPGRHVADIPVPIEDGLNLNIMANPKQKLRAALTDLTEYGAIVVAALFAAATAISTTYDATFGSYMQYLGLLLWAAGAATGGNFFKQMSASGTVGGQGDSTLKP